MKRLSILLLAGVLLVGGCCDNCDKPFLGEFFLTTAEEDWIAFWDKPALVFRSATGDEQIFSYIEPFTGFEELIFDCEETKCGFCCNEFRNAYIFTQLTSSSGNFVFDITLRKDFVNNTPLDNLEDITASMSITFNNFITCNIIDIPNATFTETLNLNNKDYFQVFTCDNAGGSVLELQGEPVKFYFTKKDGIVGFEVVGDVPGETVLWNLQD